MKQTLDALDQKIETLLQKKKEIEQKQAQMLFKTIHPLLGDRFTPTLAATILSDTWLNASKDQKNRWLKAADSFQGSPTQLSAQISKWAKTTHPLTTKDS